LEASWTPAEAARGLGRAICLDTQRFENRPDVARNVPPAMNRLRYEAVNVAAAEAEAAWNRPLRRRV